MIKTFKDFIEENYKPDFTLILEDCKYDFDGNPGKDFGENWIRLDGTDKVYRYVKERLPEYFKKDRQPGIMEIYKVDGDDYYIAYIHGGDNGPGSWVDYCEYLKNVFSNFDDSWMIDMDNDCADDVWTLRLGFRIQKEKSLKIIQ